MGYVHIYEMSEKSMHVSTCDSDHELNVTTLLMARVPLNSEWCTK